MPGGELSQTLQSSHLPGTLHRTAARVGRVRLRGSGIFAAWHSGCMARPVRTTSTIGHECRLFHRLGR